MIEHKDYLYLMGGVDIDSHRYNKKPHPAAQHPNLGRDEKEFSAVKAYMAADKPIIGVCRGAQLLCIANGGELWQHSLHHNQSHNLMIKHGVIPNATAGHHQIMRLDSVPEEDYKVIAWCPFYTPVYDEEGGQHILEAAPEVVWFPKTKCLAIQPHPEWQNHGEVFRDWADELVEKLTGQKNIFDVHHHY